MPDSTPEALLVLVTGAPTTGNSTLSRRVAADLTLPLISSDDLKETLFGSLVWSTVEWSQTLGRASFELMYLLIDRFLAAQVFHVVDCNRDAWYASLGYSIFKTDMALRQSRLSAPRNVTCCCIDMLLAPILANITPVT